MLFQDRQKAEEKRQREEFERQEKERLQVKFIFLYALKISFIIKALSILFVFVVQLSKMSVYRRRRVNGGRGRESRGCVTKSFRDNERRRLKNVRDKSEKSSSKSKRSRWGCPVWNCTSCATCNQYFFKVFWGLFIAGIATEAA